LAEAGFYLTPESGKPRSTTCFLCKASTDAWQLDSNAWLVHQQLSPNCPWVILHVYSKDFIDSDGQSEYAPTSQVVHDARLATFMDWPHNKSGWKCNSKSVRYLSSLLIACRWQTVDSCINLRQMRKIGPNVFTVKCLSTDGKRMMIPRMYCPSIANFVDMSIVDGSPIASFSLPLPNTFS
jgi:hypothetical protein